jgi:ribosomal protein S18 acetylase RimI-like enzyme
MAYKIRNLLATDYLSIKDIFRDEFLGDDITYRDLRTAWRYRNTELSLGAISSTNDLLGFTLVRKNYLGFLGTHKHYQGKKIGSSLLKKVVSKTSNTCLHLYPMSQNQRLIEWYARFGFRKTTGGYMNIHHYKTRSKASETS